MEHILLLTNMPPKIEGNQKVMTKVKPVFIFSLPRSGSTLLQRILGGHADIQSKSECWFLLPFVFTLKKNGTFAQYSHISISNAMKDLIGELPYREQDYYDALGSFALELYGKLAGEECRYFLDKTPRYYLIINEIEKMFHDAKFIFLFRNPLATFASMIESFFSGNLGDYRHKIDAFEGPSLLAKAYQNYKYKSISIKYEDLLSDPEIEIKKVCNYLEIEYSQSMVGNFNKVNFQGSMGDSIGTKKYNEINRKPLEKWKTTFGTSYRKKYALNYLEKIGPEVVSLLGYDFNKLKSEILSMEVKRGRGFSDRYYLWKGELMTFFEIPLLKKRFKNSVIRKDSNYIHL